MAASEVRVLVVDDSADAAAPLMEILRDKGYTVEWARDGDQALASVERALPHCVVLDVHMPGINGLELARRLRARFQHDVVLIAISGVGQDDAAVAECFDLVDHYLAKPLDFTRLDLIFPPVTA